MQFIQIKLQARETAYAMKVYRRYAMSLKEELGLTPSEKFMHIIAQFPPYV